MHTENLSRRTHDPISGAGPEAAEGGTRLVAWITAATMAIGIAAGGWLNSMALLTIEVHGCGDAPPASPPGASAHRMHA